MNTEKTVVLFGATGTIGAYAALDIKSHGYNVIAVGRRQSDNGFFSNHGIAYQSINIENRQAFLTLPQSGITAIIHLAGPIPARMKVYRPQEYIDGILMGTLNVLDYCVMSGCPKIIFAQSIADIMHLYGNSTPLPADANMRFPLNSDHSIYSICKNAAVNLIEHYHCKYGISRFILRFPNIYLYHPNPYYFVDGIEKWQSYRYLIERAKDGLPLELWGDPSCKRDIVYVKDCTQIIWLALDSELEGGVYNVGTGHGTSLEEQINGIIDVFSPKTNKSSIVYRPEMPDAPSYVMDVSKTIDELGYCPLFNYHDYLVDMKKEMDENRFISLWGPDIRK